MRAGRDSATPDERGAHALVLGRGFLHPAELRNMSGRIGGGKVAAVLRLNGEADYSNKKERHTCAIAGTRAPSGEARANQDKFPHWASLGLDAEKTPDVGPTPLNLPRIRGWTQPLPAVGLDLAFRLG